MERNLINLSSNIDDQCSMKDPMTEGSEFVYEFNHSIMLTHS